MFGFGKEVLVDAIEEGKIVKVSESYAKQEGLLILRRPQISPERKDAGKKADDKKDGRGFIGFDEMRRPLRHLESDIKNELVQNFQWILSKKRKEKGITRKQLAEAVGDSEYNLKLLENGMVPGNNFVLINKLENYFKISLRNSKSSSIMTPKLSAPRIEKKEAEKPSTDAKPGSENVLGGEIEILSD